MANICKNCSKEVTPEPDGKCPECGSDKGYAVSRTWTYKYSIEDFRNAKKTAMRTALDDAYRTLKELEEKQKNNEQNRKIIQAKIKHLQDQEDALMKLAEENAKLDFESLKKETNTKTFTAGVIIGTLEQQKIYELENKLKAKEEVEKRILEMKDDITTIKVKLGTGQTLVLGAVASFIGTVIFTLWTYFGTIVAENPLIFNSTKP